MQDHYKTLGISSAATREEIRRAYRVLARRYHPDVNPGRTTTDTFRQISTAYEVLSDPDKRRQYDDECEVQETFSSAFDRAHQAYRKQQAAVKKPSQTTPSSQPKPQPPPKPEPKAEPKPERAPNPAQKVTHPTPKPKPTKFSALKKSLEYSISRARNILSKSTPQKRSGPTISSLALMEVSISAFEAIAGVKKTIEVTEKNGEEKKISVAIPAGVRQGSIVRLRSKENETEEIIIVIRVAHHPWLSITHRGLTLEIPITISEAITGAKVQVPSLGDPLLVTVEPGMQSGREVRLKGQGIPLPDGTRGDLYIRFMIKIPSCAEAPSATTQLGDLEALYNPPVREHLPRTIMDAESGT